MGIHKNYVNKKTHSSFFIYNHKLSNMGIQENIFMYAHILKFVTIKKELHE